MSEPVRDRLSGLLIVVAALCAVFAEVGGFPPVAALGGLAVLVFMALSLGRAGRAERIFIAVAGLLVAFLAATRADWMALLAGPLASAGFIAAFFAAVASLRNAASTSPGIERCGRFFAAQPDSRGYAMLTGGGALFSLMLSYGALSLLGAMALRAARTEPDPEAQRLRTRRMLLAVQRGVVSMLTWSPIAFPMALSTAIIPGATWSAALPACMVSAALLLVLGWALDRHGRKPAMRPDMAPSLAPAEAPPPWSDLKTLAVLLVTLFALILLVHAWLGVRAVAAVVIVVPPFYLAWVALQRSFGAAGWAHAVERASSYAFGELPSYRTELVILSMAGFIGGLGALIATPALSGAGFGASLVPAPVFVVGLLWLMPLTGQIGMNPILTLSLVGPLLPPAAAIGTTPSAFVLAIASGWALSGASSPYTVTTMLVGRLGGATARRVGLGWNLGFTLIGGLLLSAWLLVFMRF